MVDLVLNAGRQKPSQRSVFGPLDIGIANIDNGRAFHLGGLFRDRQAALFENGGRSSERVMISGLIIL